MLHKDTPRFDEEESVWDPSASVAPSVSAEASWAASASVAVAASASVAASAEPYYYDYGSASAYPEASASGASYYEEASRALEVSTSAVARPFFETSKAPEASAKY